MNQLYPTQGEIMSDQARMQKLYATLEKVREMQLGEDWQYQRELRILEDKLVAEIKRLQPSVI